MTIREADKVTVCRWCLRGDIDGDLRHGEMWGCGEELDGIGCIWPCGHEVADRYEHRCLSCHPMTEAELAEAPF